jgi:hypothetical protein
MGKQANSWIGFVKKTWGKMKRTQKNVSYKDAMKKAKHEWKQIKKIGGAPTGVASNAATVSSNAATVSSNAATHFGGAPTGVASNAATVSSNAATHFGGAFDPHADPKRKRMGGSRKNRKGTHKNRKGTHKNRKGTHKKR